MSRAKLFWYGKTLKYCREVSVEISIITAIIKIKINFM
jgi:hypothetical protein